MLNRELLSVKLVRPFINTLHLEKIRSLYRGMIKLVQSSLKSFGETFKKLSFGRKFELHDSRFLKLLNRKLNIELIVREMSNLFKSLHKNLFKKINMKAFQVNADGRYKKHFFKTVGPKIYNKHINGAFASCAFCSHLVHSTCHKHCFTCSKRFYEGCDLLLPGVYGFGDPNLTADEKHTIPWLFKVPCAAFDRLAPDEYFKHFYSFNRNVAVANYETIEGIFTGISWDKKPCHICASTDISILNKCEESGYCVGSKPCGIVVKKLLEVYDEMIL